MSLVAFLKELAEAHEDIKQEQDRQKAAINAAKKRRR